MVKIKDDPTDNFRRRAIDSRRRARLGWRSFGRNSPLERRRVTELVSRLEKKINRKNPLEKEIIKKIENFQEFSQKELEYIKKQPNFHLLYRQIERSVTLYEMGKLAYKIKDFDEAESMFDQACK